MKTRKILTASALLLFGLATTFTSCKKDDKKAPNCKLVAASINAGNTTNTYTFSYNNDSKVSQIINRYEGKTTTTSLDYSGNTISVVAREGNILKDKQILTRNSAGRLLRVDELDIVSDEVESSVIFEYAANGDLLTITFKSDNDPPNVITLATTNGNITSSASKDGINTFEYYTDQAWRAGDYYDLTQRILFGNNFYIVNRNLIKSLKSGNDITNISYDFDANNNISAAHLTNNGKATDVTYQHQCQ